MTSARRPRLAAIVPLLIISFVLAACQEPARVPGMVPQTGSATQRQALYDGIAVLDVAGGDFPGAFGPGDVTNRSFEEALRQAMAQSNLLATEAAVAPFALTAAFYVEGGLSGRMGYVASVAARYRLIDRRSDRVLLDEDIRTVGQGTSGDSILAIERRRLAHERAVRENIERLVQRLLAMNPKRR